jgi:hypothetical protein
MQRLAGNKLDILDMQERKDNNKRVNTKLEDMLELINP